MMGDIQAKILSNATEEEIEELLKQNLCAQLPFDFLKQACSDMITENVPQIIDMVFNSYDLKQLCSVVDLCPGDRSILIKQKLIKTFSNHVSMQQLSPAKKVNDGDICADCQNMMGDIQAKILSNATEEEIEELLKQNLCAQLPFDFLKQACSDMITENLPQIIDMVFNSYDLKELCSVVDLCPGDRHILIKLKLKKTPLYKAVSNLKTGIPCQICVATLTELRQEDMDPNNQLKIMSFIEGHLCSYLGPYKDQCVATISEYGPEIFQLIADNLDPDVTCDALFECSNKLCKKTTIKHEKDNSIRILMEKMLSRSNVHHVKGGFKCQICKQVIQELHKLLLNNATKEALVEELEKVCTVLPEPYQDQCDATVEMYGNEIVDLVIEELDPERTCIAIDMCSSNMPQRKLFNKNRGPLYDSA